MNWTELLKSEVDDVYRATEGLMKLVKPECLDWRPATGSNWLSMGQLLHHITNACGFCCKGFATGDWGMPEGAELQMPTAETMPSVESVEQALALLAEDKRLALETIAQAGEDDLRDKLCAAPWEPSERQLGVHLLHMIEHLAQHKAQLFYYLKLLGEPVGTPQLWGMTEGGAGE